MARIAYVVCGNGFGHLRRVAEVMTEVGRLDSACSQLLIISDKQFKVLNEWGFWKSISREKTSIEIADLENNLTANLPQTYTQEIYHQSWMKVYQALDRFEPDQIVSDNLAGILERFPDTILMGSFLWPDCLLTETPSPWDAICKREIDLLHMHRPRMFGLADMAMPFVVQSTRFSGLPWFCRRVPRPPKSKRDDLHILVSGGGTLKATESLNKALSALVKVDGVRIFADRFLGSQPIWANQVTAFDFTEDSFGHIDLIICRPGIGILTDAVKHIIPVCVMEEADKEMKHNADRVVQLSMGIRWNKTDFGYGQLHELAHGHFREAIAGLRTGGAKQVAERLVSKGINS